MTEARATRSLHSFTCQGTYDERFHHLVVVYLSIGGEALIVCDPGVSMYPTAGENFDRGQ